MLLDGKVILVTGAGRGLGRGIAQAVSQEGARVIVTDIRLPEAEEISINIQREWFAHRRYRSTIVKTSLPRTHSW